MTSSFADLRVKRSLRQGKALAGATFGHRDEESEVKAKDKQGQGDSKLEDLSKLDISPPDTLEPSASQPDGSRPPQSFVTTSYPDLPSNIHLRISSTAGRSFFATTTIPSSTRIVTTSPLSFALSTSCVELYCSHCWLSPYELSVRKGEMGGTTAQMNELGRGMGKCAGCGVMRYCSKGCQSDAWRGHAAECRALKALKKMKEMEGKGKEGEENTSESRGWIPPESIRALGKICWTRRRLLQAQKAVNPSFIANPANTSESEHSLWWNQISSLQSHRSTLSSKEKEPFAMLAMELARYLSAGETDPFVKGAITTEREKSGASGDSGKSLKMVDVKEFGFETAGELIDLCCAFATNSFTLSSSSLTPIGVAISPLVALFNHSCEPNAVVVFPNGGGPGSKGMHVIALREIKEGEEILTSYIDVALPFHLRQSELKETYHFDCRCTLCLKSLEKVQPGKGAWVDPRWAVKHPGCAGNGIARMPDLALGLADCICNACGEEFEVVVGRIRNLNTATEKIIQSSKTTIEYEASTLSNLVEGMLELLPLSSHPLLPLLRIQSLALSEPIYAADQNVMDLFGAIQALALHWKGSQAVYPVNHPSLGIMLAELGKLLNAEAESGDEGADKKATSSTSNLAIKLPVDVGGRMGLARETMVNALKVLRVGFGKSGGLVGKEIEMLVEGISREMAMYQKQRR